MKLDITVRQDRETKIWFIEGFVENMTEKELDNMSNYITNCPNTDEDNEGKTTYSDWLNKGFETEFKYMVPELKKELKKHFENIKKELKIR